jgi:hypothetical protein
MNLNELFFFKVFQCYKDTNNKINIGSHNEKNCYFYHVAISYENGIKTIIEKYRRREPISFSEFFKKLQKNLKEEENFNLSIDTIFEFKKNNKYLNYYTDSLPFNSQNEYIYYDSDYCKNEIEFYYHINRYKKNICRFFKINGSCKKKFCFCKHITNWQKIENEKNKDELESEKSNINGDDLDEGIITFNKKLSKWKEIKEIKFKEIIEIYNYVLSFENKYLSDFQKKEIKKYFSFFQQYYNENSLNNINNNYFNIIEKNSNPNEKIIREIQNQFNQNINSSNIYKDSNLLESLKISTNVCFFSKYDLIKLSEVIKFIYAMLNSSNGVIIYGGNEKDKSIKGISLKRKERDDFKRWFNTEFFKLLIQYEGNIEYKFYDVANNNNDECILVIKVKQIKKNKLLTTSFSQKCFIINEKFLKQKSEEKNKILDENDVIELNTKEYLELLRKRLLVYYKRKFRLI